MAKPSLFVSATIVLIFTVSWAKASPLETAPEAPPSKEDAWPENKNGENLSIAPAPKVDHVVKPSANLDYYPYRQALTIRFGQASKYPKTKREENVIGFLYMFPKFLSPKLEAGADVHENGRGHLHVGWRYILREKSRFRPSYKIGADHMADGDEGLATFARINNYYLRLSGTLEYAFYGPYSLRLEPEFLANFANQRIVITLGLSRGW